MFALLAEMVQQGIASPRARAVVAVAAERVEDVVDDANDWFTYDVLPGLTLALRQAIEGLFNALDAGADFLATFWADSERAGQAAYDPLDPREDV